jgi:methyl-accepting chemotaxis protein
MQEMLTSLQGLVSETEKLTKAAVEGNLAIRGEAEKFEGGYRAIIRGFNETLDAVIGPIDEAAEVLKEVAERDLTARVKGNYKGDLAKIKDALNMAVNNLDVALAQVAGSAEQVAAAASQISSGSQTLSQGASQQAGSLEETSSSLQEMASISKQNATNAKEARQLTEKAELSTNQGMDNMKRLSLAIDKIKNSSDATAKIVKAINEIAFQTNLLALNAAVEAARAGDAGKGFAVVADEVRTLALRSADAARQTENLIEGSVKNAEAGVSINREVIHSLEEINAQVRRVSEVMAGIAAASSQQSQGVEQTTSAVEQMNLVTQQTAANAEESASTSQELSSQAEAMRNIVQGFKLSSSTISVAQAPSEKAVFKAVNARTEVARKPAKTVNIFRRPVVQQKPADEPDMMALSEF